MTRRTPGRAEALALLPELEHRALPTPTRRHRGWRALLVAVTGLLVAGVFSGAYAQQALAPDLLERLDPDVVTLAPADVARYRAYAAATAQAGPQAPLVLSYHDVRADSKSPYVLDPADFEAHLQMLHLAGFRSLTLAELQAYRDGGPAPDGRTVLITFDDGTAGLWQHADAVLERYGFTAVSFLITGSVETRRPYYLSWAEVSRMADSGRWEFGSHTHDLHRRGDAGAGTHEEAHRDGATDPTGLLARQHGPDGRPEPRAAYRARIGADLDASIASFVEHDLPAPTAFAYPFSETADATAATELAARFDLVFVNENRTTRPVPPASARGVAIERAEIFGGVDQRALFTRLQGMATLPLPDSDEVLPILGPATGRTSWTTPARLEAPLTGGVSGLTPQAAADPWVSATFAPARTSTWVDYRVSATLNPPAGGAVSLVVRSGSAQESRVRVTRDAVEVLRGEGRLSRTPLTPSPGHRVRVEVARTHTRVVVDDLPILTLPDDAPGGPGLQWLAGTDGAHGTVADLAVSRSP